MKRRILLISTGVFPLLLRQSISSHAQMAVRDTESVMQQLRIAAQTAQQYALQLQQYQQEFQQLQYMVQNTTALPQTAWSQVVNNIMQVRNIANASSLLTGNSGSMIARLNSLGGYSGGNGFTPQTIGPQFDVWQQTISNANNALGRTLGLQQGQELNNAQLQNALQLQSDRAVGQMQAIQAGNRLAGLTSEQLNQIQVTLTATAQAQGARDLVAHDRQAIYDQGLQNLLATTPIPITGYRTY